MLNKANIIAFFELYFKRDGFQKNLDNKLSHTIYSYKQEYLLRINAVSLIFKKVVITDSTIAFYNNDIKVALVWFKDIDNIERIN